MFYWPMHLHETCIQNKLEKLQYIPLISTANLSTFSNIDIFSNYRIFPSISLLNNFSYIDFFSAHSALSIYFLSIPSEAYLVEKVAITIITLVLDSTCPPNRPLAYIHNYIDTPGFSLPLNNNRGLDLHTCVSGAVVITPSPSHSVAGKLVVPQSELLPSQQAVIQPPGLKTMSCYSKVCSVVVGLVCA